MGSDISLRPVKATAEATGSEVWLNSCSWLINEGHNITETNSLLYSIKNLKLSCDTLYAYNLCQYPFISLNFLKFECSKGISGSL